MSKDPAVLFYTQDFLTGTFCMTDAQVGKYIRLLCLQQQNGGLTERQMLQVCGEKDEDIWSKFEFENGHYFNKRMSLEANKRKKYCESRRDVRTSYVNRMEISNKKDEISNKKEEKEIVFKSDVFEFLEKYPESMLNKFCNYWMETNKSGTKMRYELQPVFEISKRLATWASRDKDIVKASPDAITYKELVYKFNQGETDVWDKYVQVNPGDKRSLWTTKK